MSKKKKRETRFHPEPKPEKKGIVVTQKLYNLFYTILLWFLLLGGAYYVWLMPRAKTYVHVMGWVMLAWGLTMMIVRSIRFARIQRRETDARIAKDIEREKLEAKEKADKS